MFVVIEINVNLWRNIPLGTLVPGTYLQYLGTVAKYRYRYMCFDVICFSPLSFVLFLDPDPGSGMDKNQNPG
jgi:hypothetical protein